MLANKPKVRDSGIELLRIILILQVIFLHVANYGEYGAVSHDIGGFTYILFNLQKLLFRCPVYVFMIISGYFSVKSAATMRSVLPKAGKIYSSMIFYSVLITSVAALTGIADAGLHDIVKSFFPLTSRTWYFITNYILVLLLSPAVNIALTRLSKKDFQILLLVLFLVFSVWQAAAKFPPFSSIISVNSVAETTKGRGLYGFLFMYIVGAYLRLHYKEENKIQWKYLFLFFACAAFDGILMFVLKDVELLKGYLKIVYFNNAPVAVVQGVFLFLFFRSLHFKSRAVNFLAAQSLGIYMIHEHWLMREFIWDRLFSFTQTEEFYSSISYLPIIYGIIILIFAVCTLLDLGKEKLFFLTQAMLNKRKRKERKN